MQSTIKQLDEIAPKIDQGVKNAASEIGNRVNKALDEFEPPKSTGIVGKPKKTVANELDAPKGNDLKGAKGNRPVKYDLNYQTEAYANLINSNKPWSWKNFPGGDKLKAGTKYPDFESAGLLEKVESLPEKLWLASDYQQFKWLDSRIPGGRPAGFTWHHSEISGRMELVPFGAHNIINHQGGRSVGHWAYGKR
nr:HNH endonuclease [Pseudoalteromonas arctica]